MSIYLAVRKANANIQSSDTALSCFKLCSSNSGRNSCSFIVSSLRIEGGVFNTFLVAFNITQTSGKLDIKAKELLADEILRAKLYYYKDGTNLDIYMSVPAGYIMVNVLPLSMLKNSTDISPYIVSAIPTEAVEITTE